MVTQKVTMILENIYEIYQKPIQELGYVICLKLCVIKPPMTEIISEELGIILENIIISETTDSNYSF